MICTNCPRLCGVDRKRARGFCLAPDKMVISKVMLHQFEETIISVGKGSGAIFFSGCNLRCEFCQNFPISHKIKGKKVGAKGFVKIFKKLEQMGAENINLVTPSHYTSQIVDALKIYKPKIPVVWNSNGYETIDMIESLRGLVDVFLVDLKYSNNELAIKYSKAPNYVKISRKAILKMRELAPKDIIENGKMLSGLIVRLLVLPSHTFDSIGSLKFVLDKLGAETIVSIMSQYEPRYNVYLYPEINRKLSPVEYKRVVSFARNNNMTNCFTQDLTSANSIYTPKF